MHSERKIIIIIHMQSRKSLFINEIYDSILFFVLLF